jgi:hypothetical protein
MVGFYTVPVADLDISVANENSGGFMGLFSGFFVDDDPAGAAAGAGGKEGIRTAGGRRSPSSKGGCCAWFDNALSA